AVGAPRVLGPAPLELEQLRRHRAPIPAEPDDEVLLEEEIRRRELGDQRVVRRDPAERLDGITTLELAERPPDDGGRALLPVEPPRRLRHEPHHRAAPPQHPHEAAGRTITTTIDARSGTK